MQYDRLNTMLNLLQEHGVEMKPVSGKYLGKCPVHLEKTESFYVYSSGNGVCFGCGFKGDALELYQQLYNATFIDAKKALGLWDYSGKTKSIKQVKPKYPAVHKHKTVKESYQIARESFIDCKDISIDCGEMKLWNFEFIAKVIAESPVEKQFDEIFDIHRTVRIKSRFYGQIFIGTLSDLGVDLDVLAGVVRLSLRDFDPQDYFKGVKDENSQTQ